MRIGVVTSSYPRHDGDAAGSFVAAHVAVMRAAGHEVEVVRAPASPLFDGGAPDALERGTWRTYLGAARITASMAAQVAVRARHWDLAVAHWLVPSAVATLPSAISVFPSRLPLLAIAHGGDVHTLRRLHLLRPALHALRARRASLAFVSGELRNIARVTAPELGAYLDQSLVQPMGIDVGRFAAIARARNPASRPTILVVARLVPIKGVDVAIDAHRRLAVHADLVIAGDGPERSRLARTAGPLVRFLGAVDASTRDRLLQEATVVVIPSRILPNGRTEGTPMVALEALAAGVPVVASNVGGLCDLASHAGVTLVRPEDPDTLGDAIARAIAEPATAVLPRELSAYDWQRVASRLFSHAGFAESGRLCEAREAAGQSISRRGA